MQTRSILILTNFILILEMGAVFAQQSTGTLIEDPAIRKKCNVILERREEKKQVRFKLTELLKKNDQLLADAEIKRQTTIHKLSRKKTVLEHKLRVTNGDIQSMNEKMIKSGCPPINLD